MHVITISEKEAMNFEGVKRGIWRHLEEGKQRKNDVITLKENKNPKNVYEILKE